jgi:hypothetical protein
MNSRNTAGAANAPISFARTEDLRPYFATYPSAEGDGSIVHSVDFIGPIGAFSATGGAWQQQASPVSFQVSPGSPGFVWLSNYAQLFQKYKLKKLVLWYEHYVSTAVAGQVVLQFIADPTFNSNAALTQAQSQNASNYTSGACYEDFCHDCTLSGIDRGKWFNTETAVGTGTSIDDNYVGLIYTFTANGAVSQVSTGNLWVEAVWEFNGRKTPSVTVGLSQARTLLMSEALTRAQKELGCRKILTRILDEQERDAREAKEQEDPGERLYKELGLEDVTSSVKTLKLGNK